MKSFKSFVKDHPIGSFPIKDDEHYHGTINGMPSYHWNYFLHLLAPVHSGTMASVHEELINEIELAVNAKRKVGTGAEAPKITSYYAHPLVQKMNDMTRAAHGDKNPITEYMRRSKGAWNEMMTNDSTTQRQKENEAHNAWNSFVQEHSKLITNHNPNSPPSVGATSGHNGGPPLNEKPGWGSSQFLGSNGKMEKSKDIPPGLEPARLKGKKGAKTIGLSMAPADSGGHTTDVCKISTPECEQGCLGLKAGQNVNPRNFYSKVLRTHFAIQHPEHAAYLTNKLLRDHVHSSEEEGYHPAYRANVTSDIDQREVMPHKFFEAGSSTSLPTHLQHMSSDRLSHYDYTKNKGAAMRSIPGRDLTFSSTGPNVNMDGVHHAHSNDQDASDVLKAGGKVAMVVSKKGAERLKGFKDMSQLGADGKPGRIIPHVNGDDHDFRPIDHETAGLQHGTPGHGVITTLKLKGPADAGNFVHHPNDEGYVEFNHPQTVRKDENLPDNAPRIRTVHIDDGWAERHTMARQEVAAARTRRSQAAAKKAAFMALPPERQAEIKAQAEVKRKAGIVKKKTISRIQKSVDLRKQTGDTAKAARLSKQTPPENT